MNVIPEVRNNYQVSFKVISEASYPIYRNIIHLTASPINDGNVAVGSRILYVNIQVDQLKIKIDVDSANEMIWFWIPQNQELDVTIAKYQYANNQARVKVFIDGIERYSGVKSLISPMKDVSCFAPSANYDVSPPTRDLKFTLQPPIFGKKPSMLRGALASWAGQINFLK